MDRCCVTYTSDANYLFPTLLSALQARENVPEQTDIVICHIGDVTEAFEIVGPICEHFDIKLVQVDRTQIDNLPVCYARLFLDEILGSEYERIIYIDGDTQVCGSLTALLTIPLRPGVILAAIDPMTLNIRRNDRYASQARGYFEALGLIGDQVTRYFNAGVLGFNAKDWPAIREACFRLKASRNFPLRFHDQDLLNLVASDSYLQMSFKWNYPSYFLTYKRLQSAINPHIHHFMSNPRPWQGPYLPWGRSLFEEYRLLTVRFPQLEKIKLRDSRKYKLKHAFLQYYKAAALRTFMPPAEFFDCVMLSEADAIV